MSTSVSHAQAGWLDGRARPLVKKTYFTPDEWRQASRRLARLRALRPNLTWQEYSRTLAVHGEIRVINAPFDPHRMLVILDRIAANINEIAHQANRQGGADRAQSDAAFALVSQCTGAVQQLVVDWDRMVTADRKKPRKEEQEPCRSSPSTR